MKYDDNQFQVGVEPYKNIVTDVDVLEKYLVWKPIQEKIRALERKRTELLKSTLSIPEVKMLLEKQVEAEKINREPAKKELHQEVQYIQNHDISVGEVAIRKLARCYILQEGIIKDALNLLNGEDFEPGMPKNEREKKLKAIEKEIENLKAKQPHYTGVGFDAEDYIEKWKVIAPRFCEPVNAGGKWLDLNNAIDKRVLKVYENLKLGDIPKIRLEYPVKIDSKEYSVPPGYGNPLWEK